MQILIVRIRNLFLISILTFFFLDCSYPYLFLVDKITIKDKRDNYFQIHPHQVYIENKNLCVEYNIIFNTELRNPYLPISFDVVDQKKINLIEKQFFWIRIYLKNISDQNLSLAVSDIRLTDNEKIFIIRIEEFYQIPYFIGGYPIFWYVLPKNPIFYLYKENVFWYKELYNIFNPVVRTNEYKFEYYKKFFSSQQSRVLIRDEEILFYLPFPHLENNRTYLFIINLSRNQNCKNIEIQFTFSKENKKNDDDDSIQRQNLYSKLNQQIFVWEKNLEKVLKKHQTSEKTFWERLFN